MAKSYPFSMARNAHNLELVSNRCFNLMCDMERGECPWDEAEYDRLDHMRERAQYFLGLASSPVVFLPGAEWAEVKELSALAVEYRSATCVARGRYDLLQYC